jgi:hypothetical protein
VIGRGLLYTIQSGEISEMYSTVTDAALYMATGGFLAEANTILSALWLHNLPHDPNTWLADRAFKVLWHTADQPPPFVPFPPLGIDQIESQYRSYIGGDHYAYPMPAVEWGDLTGKDAFRQAQIWFVIPERDSDSLLLLQKALQNWQALSGYEFCCATTMAAELAAKQGDDFLAIRMAQWWAEQYHHYTPNYVFPILAQSRHLAPLLLKGAAAKALKLTQEKCRTVVDQVTAAVNERIASGPSLLYEQYNWQELVHKLNSLTIAEVHAAGESQQEWIGRREASAAAISATEKRLRLTLPEDYKAFVAVSNGLSAFPLCNPALLPVEEIDFYKYLEDAELYHITKTYPDNKTEEGTIEPYTERAILISQIPDEQMVWLIPPIDIAEEWQTWFFAAWLPGERRYRSFRHYIESCIQQLEKSIYGPTW